MVARILMIANNSWNLQHFRRPVVRGLAQAGHHVVTVSPDQSGVVIDDLEPRHRTWAMHRSSMNPIGEAATLFRLRKIIAEEKPDLIFSFTIKPNIYSALAGKLMRVPVVPNVSGLGSSFLADGPLRAGLNLLYKIAFGSVPRVFFQNRDDRRLFLQSGIVSEAQSQVLPGSGIDLRHFEAKELPDAPRFLMIGRLLRDKGVREYAEAAAMLKGRLPGATVSLLGDLDPQNPTGIPADELQAWIDGAALTYLGSSTDVRPFIQDSSVVVLPSYREGLPRSLLEGAAMGRPLIAADVPGCRELVREGVTGFLCAARDASSLADAMERMARVSLRDRVRMGASARAMVEADFDDRVVVDAYLAAVEAFSR